jgi:hypothetical protein
MGLGGDEPLPSNTMGAIRNGRASMALRRFFPLALVRSSAQPLHRVLRMLLVAFRIIRGRIGIRIHVHSFEPFPGTKVSARAWGKAIQHHDGQVVLDPIPWPAS